MKNLTAFIITGLLLAALVLATIFLWDGFEAYIAQPLANLPAIYTTSLILGVVFALFISWKITQLVRLRSHSKLLPEKAKLYQELIGILQKKSSQNGMMISLNGNEEYANLKAKLVILGSQQVLQALIDWESSDPDSKAFQPPLESLLVAIRKDLQLPNRRLSQHFFSNLLQNENGLSIKQITL